MHRFPKDYDGILNNYNVQEAEPGLVELVAPDDLTIDEVYIEGPNAGESYYSIPAINLISKCEDYEPDFILCYLPNEEKYGTWDCDHWVLYYFDDVSWYDIKENPIKYLNTQWSRENEKAVLFKPDDYELINGWPI